MQTFKTRLFIFLLAAATVYAACRKTDRVAKAPPAGDNTTRFFAAHASTHPLVQSVTRFMQTKNEQYEFVPQLIKQIGYPQWDKSMLVSRQGKSTSGRGNETGDSATIIYVPFVRDSQNFVNASLLVKLTPTDTAFQYLQDWQYASYGFDTTGDNGNARNVFHLFANFDREVFGRTAFKITDERLFGEPAAGEFVIAKLRPQQNNQQRQSILISVTMCDYIDVCYNPPGGNPCGNLECTVDCPQYEYTYTECTTIWVDDGWTPAGGGSGGGGGTGGGGGGTGWIPPPCPGGTARTELYENCTPGWEPTGGGSPSANQTIIDSLQGYPCAQGVLAQLPSINDTAKKILQNVFGLNNNVNIIFIADSTQPDNVNGYVDTVIFNPGTGKYDSRIVLNGKMLRKASKEFIAKTMFHESIHAYIYYYWKLYKNGIMDSTSFKAMFPKIWQYKSSSQIAQHTEIANNFIDDISSIISAFNPLVADSTRKAMAWGGLSETVAWKNLGSDTFSLNRLRSISRDSSLAKMQSLNLNKCR